ncbi:MAG: hypothetical protein SH848_16245 [Saprospiraceae bacterium]|nr:hypothetical protein [Saprospiraceae bacterium]MDZ4705476.1 hypothetical protein [Saprospiraceae bacterium]
MSIQSKQDLEGMSNALKTFISTKARYVYPPRDGWIMKAKDGSFVARHEHTLIVTDGYPVILTANNGI